MNVAFFLLAGRGIEIARVADLQLDAFMRENALRRRRGEQRLPVLGR